jgi:NAD+ kinase
MVVLLAHASLLWHVAMTSSDHLPPARLALVVHPTRPIASAIETIESWAGRHGLDVVQAPAPGSDYPRVAAEGAVEAGDLVIALGGDGTVLAALRASAPVGSPVLGVACGSLGALTAVPAGKLIEALDRVLAGDWTPRRLPALGIHPLGAPDEWAVNDFVVVRHATGQVVVNLYVDEELYVRLAGDGLIVATPIGSSAYSMAAGGPLIVPGTEAIVCTPVAQHGGSAPPLVVPGGSAVRIEVHPNFAGFDVEIDGQPQVHTVLEYRLDLHDEKVMLVSFGEPGPGLTGLRARGLIIDSPRVLARDERLLAAEEAHQDVR